MPPKNEPNRHAGSGDKVPQNRRPPSKGKGKGKKPKVKKPKPVSTTESQSMAYVTLENIEKETSILEENWSLFAIKELLDNAWDWLNDEYPITGDKDKDKEIRKITVRAWVTNSNNPDFDFLHIALRNSNINNKSVFNDLDKIFNFKVWHGTKRYQHRMTCGSLGDALKRCLGMGYASWTKGFDPDENEGLDKQWEQPLIVRCNKQEFQIFIKVNLGISWIGKEIIAAKRKPKTRDIGSDTQVEVTLPVASSSSGSLINSEYLMGKLQQYYELYRIGKSKNTEFSDLFDIPTIGVEQ